MEKLRAYWKRIAAVIASVGVVAGFLYGAGEVGVKADDWVDAASASHLVAQVAKDRADQALEYQRLAVEREMAAAVQEREKWRAILQFCLDKTITDPKVCAEAEAKMK